MNEILAALSEKERQLLKETKQPEWMNPMLAKLTEDYFSDENWIFERKLDGERCIVYKQGEQVRIMSRNQKNLNHTYPEMVEAFKEQPGDFIADGEMVAFEGNLTSFSKLQRRMHLKDKDLISNHTTRVFFYVFDLPFFAGYDLSRLELKIRKAILKKALTFQDPIRFTAHRNENGLEYFKEACKKGWEGLIAKKADSVYTHGRSSNWLKFKCVSRQEFVIGGYTEPQGSRKGFGSLLIGFYEEDGLHYAGKVGTGFNNEILTDLHQQMQQLETKKTAFKNNKDLPGKAVHWVKPEMVAEIGFTEWTSTKKLRHPRYFGLRRDKNPKEVIKEI